MLLYSQGNLKNFYKNEITVHSLGHKHVTNAHQMNFNNQHQINFIPRMESIYFILPGVLGIKVFFQRINRLDIVTKLETMYHGLKLKR